MTANPGPPEQCYDDCPTNRTGDTEDCTCAGTALDSDAALFARQRDDARAIVLAVSRILRDQAALSGMLRGMARRASAMRRALRARPAIPADSVAKPDGMLYALLLVWLDSPMNRESPESAAAAAASAVNWFLRAAPVSGSDTTAQPEPRTWTADDPEPPGDVRQVSAANSQVFTRRTFWQPGVGALLPWGVVAKRTGVLTEVVSSGGDTDTTEDGGDRG